MTVGNLRYTAEELGVVHVEDVYSTDIEDLWAAVTEPSRLARWIGSIEGEPVLGGHVQAHFTSTWEGTLRVDACEAPHHLLVTSEPGTDDEQTIEAFLTADGDGTRLVVEEKGFSRHDVPFHGAGWQAHLEDLGSYLAGRDPADWHGRWEELLPSYQEQADALD